MITLIHTIVAIKQIYKTKKSAVKLAKTFLSPENILLTNKRIQITVILFRMRVLRRRRALKLETSNQM